MAKKHSFVHEIIESKETSTSYCELETLLRDFMRPLPVVRCGYISFDVTTLPTY